MSRINKLLILGLIISTPVLMAHQQKESYTTITYNDRTNSLEVMMRFYLHDAEHALQQAWGGQYDLYRDTESQKLFAKYVGQSFALKDFRNRVINLSPVGNEIEGKYFWVYFEAPPPDSLASFSVTMRTLQDVWKDQVNHINFEFNDKVKSVRTSIDDNWQTIRIDQ